MIQLFIIFLSFFEGMNSCHYQSFAQSQLDSNDFCGEQLMTLGDSYSFGIWTMYAPLRRNLQKSLITTYFNTSAKDDGYHLMNFQINGAIQALVYQGRVAQYINNQYINITVLQLTKYGVLPYQFPNYCLYYEGHWMFLYFVYYKLTNYNIALYSEYDSQFISTVANYPFYKPSSKGKLQYGNQGQFTIGSTKLNLNLFPGRISQPIIFDSVYFFYYYQGSQFIYYLTNNSCFIPSPCPQIQQISILDEVYTKNNLTVKSYETDILNFNYSIEFWLRRNQIKDFPQQEMILSHGSPFKDFTDGYRSLTLICKSYQGRLYIRHQYQTYYVVPNDYRFINQTDFTFEIPISINLNNLYQWIYFRYDFIRQTDRSVLYLSLTRPEGDFYLNNIELISQKQILQYSNYKSMITFFADYRYLNPDQFKNFGGEIANFRLTYCFTKTQNISSSVNLNCHKLCKTCVGPTRWDCKSCYPEQNRYLLSTKNVCQCHLNYFEENGQTTCKLYTPKVSKVSSNIQIQTHTQCSYGEFQYWDDDYFIGCISCPFINRNPIQCINCILNSEKWYGNPICNLEYQLINDIYYSLKPLQQQLFYKVNYQKVELCEGCKSLTLCLQNQYEQSGKCIECASNCEKCFDQFCIECKIGYYLNGTVCQICQSNCIKCHLNQKNPECSQCISQYVVWNGECVECGKYCQACELRLNGNKFYKKCLQCQPNTYISLDGETCYENDILYCRQPFQFRYNNLLVSTLFYDFEPQDNQFIRTGCAYCEGYAFMKLNETSIICESSDAKTMNNCAFWMQLYEEFFCIFGNIQAISTYAKEYYCLLEYPHCQYCITEVNQQGICFVCENGYYNDYITSFCQPCPSECLNCYQSDYSKIIKLIIYPMFDLLYKMNYIAYLQNAQDPNPNDIQIYCYECEQGYTLYQDKCIINCPFNCQQCEVVNYQNICMACLQLNEYSYFQIQDGQCIQCPNNCKLCTFRTNQQKYEINPYFSNSRYDFFSNPCVVPLNDQYYYDQQIKQFIQCDKCEKQVDFDFEVSCNQTSQLNIDKLFNEQINNYFKDIETEDYYLYLNKEYVKYINYKFNFQSNSICMIEYDSYFTSTLQQNVFNLIQLNFIIEGNNSTLILNGNIILNNFTSITINNLNIQNAGLKIQNIHMYSIKMENITISSLNQNNTNSFIFNNASNIQLNLMTIKNMNYDSFSSIIVIRNNISEVNISCNNLTIIKSYFKISPLLFILADKFELNFQNTLIKESWMNQTQFSNQLQNTQLNNLKIYNSSFINSDGFFQFQSSVNIDLLCLEDSRLTNSRFIKTSAGLIIENSYFMNLSLLETSNLFYTSDFYQNTVIQFTQIQLIDILYQEKQAILFVEKSNQNVTVTVIELNMTRISLNSTFMKQNFQESIDQSIIDLDCTVVQFKNIYIQRGLGFSELSIRNANIFIENSVITLDQQYYFKSITNWDCQIQSNKMYYKTFMFLQNVMQTNLRSLMVNNIILYDSNFIDFTQTSEITDSQFQMRDCNFSSNIILQTKTQSYVSLLQIQSSSIYMIHNVYNKNLLAIQIQNNVSPQGLLFKIFSDTLIQECHFQSNIIINGSSSIFKVNSNTINISKSQFFNNSFFQYDTLKQFLVWGFESEIYQEDLENLYPISSNGGNGNLQGQQIQLSNLIVQNSYSKQGAGFTINLLVNGQFMVYNCQFINLTVNLAEQSNGGCFYLTSNSQQIKVEIIESIFSNIYSRQQGGLIYISTSSMDTIIKIQNSSFSDIYSLQGSILQIQQSQKGNPQFLMLDCQIQNDEAQFQNFINKIPSISSIEINSLKNNFSLVSFLDGFIKVKNLTISQYQYLQLFNFQNSVYLQNIRIYNLVFTRPLITFIAADQIRIQIIDFRITNCTFNNIVANTTIASIVSTEVKTSTCANNNPPEQVRLAGYNPGNQNFLLLSALRTVDGVIIFNNFDEQDQIIMNSLIINVNCDICQQGVLSFLRLQSPRIQIQGLTISNSKCGIHGCLFIESSSLRLLNQIKFSNRSQILIENLLCHNNEAQFGGCLFLKNQQINILNSEMINNIAEKGGAIFIEGPKSILDSNSLLIVNNTAKEGSAIYSNDPYFYQNKGLIFQDNTAETDSNRPFNLKIQIFQEILTPSITFFDKYHTMSKILTKEGNEVVIYMPTGIEIKNYKRFDLKSNSYVNQTYNFKIFAFSDALERLNLSGTFCNCTIIDESGQKYQNLTNYNTFYFEESSYNFDKLILYIPQDNKQYRLAIQCNSIYVPILEDQTIIGYHQNYTLQLKIKPYECQLGEYHINEYDFCHQCQIDLLQYSLIQNSTQCQIKNDQIINQITPAQVKLNPGYWRYQISSNIFDQCYNNLNNCIGGWNYGNNLCKQGYIGALCEQCDYYNIRGQGLYTQTKQYECQICAETQYINYIQPIGIIILFITLLFVLEYLIKGLKTNYYSSLLSRLQMQHLKEAIKWQFIKQIIQYFQLLSVIMELYPNYEVQILFDIIGNPFQMSPFNICRLINTNISIVYLDFIQNFVSFIVFFSIVILAKVILTKSINSIKYCFYFAYIFYGNSLIRSVLKLISFRKVQEQLWIFQNVAYLYYSQIHLWLLVCFIPILLIFSIILPGFLLFKLNKFNRFLIRNYGIWFCAFKNPIDEPIKIIILIAVDAAVISIDGHQSLRGLIAFMIVAIYYLYGNNIYMNRPQNSFELHLLQISLCIMVLSMFQSMLNLDVLRTLVYILFLFSFILMIRGVNKFQFQVIGRIKFLLVNNICKQFPKLLQYNYFKTHSEEHEQRTKKRIKILKNYVRNTSWHLPDDKLRTSCDTSHYRHKFLKMSN